MKFVWLCKTETWWKCKTLFMDIDSLIVHTEKDDIYKGIAEDVETRFDPSKFEIDRPLSKKINNCTNEWWIRWINHESIC